MSKSSSENEVGPECQGGGRSSFQGGGLEGPSKSSLSQGGGGPKGGSSQNLGGRPGGGGGDGGWPKWSRRSHGGEGGGPYPSR